MCFENEKKLKFYKVNEQNEGKRLDKLVLSKLGNLTRNQVKKFINNGKILVNQAKTKPGYNVKRGDEIKVHLSSIISSSLPGELSERSLVPEKIDLEIIYEDEHLIVVNKPKNMVVHPAPGNFKGTLVNALLNYDNELSTLGGEYRPGIIHRLDKNTSGALLVAKNNRVHSCLKEKFKRREINREYLAICRGNYPENKSIIEAPVGRHPSDRKRMTVIEGGRYAKTKVKVLKKFNYKGFPYSYLKVIPVTGRTHQIRVHLGYFGYPLVGDEIYGAKRKKEKNELNSIINGQALHAFKIMFYHPFKGSRVVFKASLPEDFSALIRRLARFHE